jgi:hypothetical protein
MAMADLVRILDPTVAGPRTVVPAVPRLPSLRGKLLGIRVDRAWQSFNRFAGHVADLARARLGVRDVYVFDPGIRVGTTEEERRKVEGFVRAVDAAVVGLGT